MKPTDIAPCGINCALCMAYGRERNPCTGCRSTDGPKPAYCSTCVIANCKKMKDEGRKYCFGCSDLPCKRLKGLDKRYRKRYGLSPLENLETIRTDGVRRFIKAEKERWTCPECGGTLSMHRPACPACGHERKEH